MALTYSFRVDLSVPMKTLWAISDGRGADLVRPAQMGQVCARAPQSARRGRCHVHVHLPSAGGGGLLPRHAPKKAQEQKPPPDDAIRVRSSAPTAEACPQLPRNHTRAEKENERVGQAGQRCLRWAKQAQVDAKEE